MAYTFLGKHLIAGEWLGTPSTFNSSPAYGPTQIFPLGTVDLVDQACEAAESAFWTFGFSRRADRAALLRAIATEMHARGTDITQTGCSETGLPEARLRGELGRTTAQLELFATHIEKGDYLDRRHDPAVPGRSPSPRPELKLMQRPVGPVAVFGASNFPLAFSTAGGDTAAALAAGCPVVVKGHSAHPGTSEIVAQAIDAAIRKTSVHPGVFSLIQGGNREVGHALVTHPRIKAVGFTGSLAGGRALFDACAARPEPIPFFGELGSVNPMFMLPAAIDDDAERLGRDWAASLTMGAGQFCTNPGVAIVIDGSPADRFVAATVSALLETSSQYMLTDGIAQAYHDGQTRILRRDSVDALLTSDLSGRMASPSLFATTGKRFISDHVLREEIFGPIGLVVRVGSVNEMLDVARVFEGQLTATLHMKDQDLDAAKALFPALERKAGRVLVNGFPTGVEVVDSMVHGGPYPASTNFGATSVGTMSIRRFLRPVSYQNLPAELLPDDLR